MGRVEETEMKIGEILGFMMPGMLYDVPLLVYRSGKSYRMVSHRLRLAVLRQRVEKVCVGNGSLYRLAQSNDAPRKPSALQTRDELKEWEACWRRFRALCEASRR